MKRGLRLLGTGLLTGAGLVGIVALVGALT